MITTHTSATIVRQAQQDDTYAILDLCECAHMESPRYRKLRFDPNKMEALIRAMIGTLATGSQGHVSVSEKSGSITGVFLGVMQEHFFGPDLVAREVLLYVRPGERGTFARAAVKLLRTFERWAVENGAVEIVVGSSTLIATDTAKRLYEYLGYHTHGFAMLKRKGG